MTYAIEDLVGALRTARKKKGINQTQLGQKVGLPQSHISKIESGAINLKLSSLIEIARVLDLELMFVPRKLVPTVQSILRRVKEGHPPTTSVTSAYRLDEDEDDA